MKLNRITLNGAEPFTDPYYKTKSDLLLAEYNLLLVKLGYFPTDEEILRARDPIRADMMEELPLYR